VSELNGTVRCPVCGSTEWNIVDWTTYRSVVCVNDDYKIGEMKPEKGTA
jgi:hypothetical protein